MQPQLVSGQAIGSCITATDSTDLAGISPQGLTLGTKAWNIGVGAYFTLTASTASLVTDQVVAVSGLAGARWIRNYSVASGVQSVNTSGATPTVAMLPTTDTAIITLGADVTKLLVNGFDMSVCQALYLSGTLINPLNQFALVKLNDSDNTGTVRGWYSSGTLTGNSISGLTITDNGAATYEFSASLVSCGAGSPYLFTTQFQSGAVQFYQGRSTLTANVTSFSLPAMTAGSVIIVRLGRP